jgi:transcriptional regulator with XRE-family HTH domain
MGSVGENLTAIRKRRGYSQDRLSELSGVPAKTIGNIEQGVSQNPKGSTLRKIAEALGVHTTALQSKQQAEHAFEDTVAEWSDVREAVFAGEVDENPDPLTVLDGIEEQRRLMGVHAYQDMMTGLPGLIASARGLQGREGRAARSRVLNLAGWLLVQTRQWDDAADVLDQADDQADEVAEASAAAITRVWLLSRQGRLADTMDVAQRMADEIEPRFSRATVAELSAWGRLYLYIANAAARDNSPGQMEDALCLARAAAHRIGREVHSDASTTRTYGPVTVAHIAAECWTIVGQPDRALGISDKLPVDVVWPTAAGRLRHRLDKTSALNQLGRYGEAMSELQQVRTIAPQWLVQQSYGRVILAEMYDRRRTLTADMRDMADFVRLDT